MKKIIAFNGSPRHHGNTERMIQEVLKGAESAGAKTKMYSLNGMKIRGCQGCMSCQKNGGFCVVMDDLKDLLNDIREVDGIVLGSPVYMGQMSAQLKLLVDRLFCFLDTSTYTHRLGEGKRAVLVFAQGQPGRDLFKTYFDLTADVLKFLGFHVEKLIVAGGTGAPGDVESQKDILEDAFKTGEALAR